MCMNDAKIIECHKLLYPKYKDKAKLVIAKYHVEYNLLITLKFNDSIELHNR